MAKYILLLVLLQSVIVPAFSQRAKTINAGQIERIVKKLSADDMQGRSLGSEGLQKAADFIASEFRKAGLTALKDNSYFQDFKTELPPSMQATELRNVVGILPGKSRASEIVIFSSHYDHIGIGKPTAEGDSIYNGANDNASGTAAVIALARYFAKKKNNERTLVFVTFTAEETGGQGSSYFSRQYDSSTIAAMFNIEMIGTDSKWGNNSAFITGYEKSTMGEILEKNLQGTPFKFYPDPYPQYKLFYRSDNATLARQGVSAHTISTSKMDNEPYYHTADDEVETLDFKNMVRIVEAIALSAGTIISGADTPSRVSASDLDDAR